MKKLKLNILQIFILSVFFLTFSLGCKSQKTEIRAKRLPAYESENSTQVMKNMLDSSNFNGFQKLFINNKEYRLTDFYKIMDTINVNKYYIQVEKDTVSNMKVLILKNV